MINIAESALALLKKSEAEARKLLKKESGPVSVAASSVHKLGEALVMIGQGTERRFLLVVADYPQVLPAGFEGELHRLSDGAALVGELSAANAAALRRHFPWTAPSSLHDCRTTIGCGDRLGLAGRGQLASIRKFKVLTSDFTEANGLLTPSLKVKRAVAVRRLAPVIDELYGGPVED